MGATHYCRGDDLLAQQQGTFPTDSDGRPMPGYVAHLVSKQQGLALLEIEAEKQQAKERARQEPTT